MSKGDVSGLSNVLRVIFPDIVTLRGSLLEDSNISREVVPPLSVRRLLYSIATMSSGT